MANVDSYTIPGLNASCPRKLERDGVKVTLTHGELTAYAGYPADQQDAKALAALEKRLAAKIERSKNTNEVGIVLAYPFEKQNGAWVERTDLPPIGVKFTGPGMGQRGTVVNKRKHAALQERYQNAEVMAAAEALLAQTQDK
jgi:hypothetical protein